MAASVDEATDINLTPLLDLILQLIMFFMITINFVRVDQFDDSIKLPTASHCLPIDDKAEEWIFLNLNKKGELVGTVSTFQLDTPEKLKLHLAREKESLERGSRFRKRTGEVKIVVILRADKECTYTRVWDVINSCRLAGFKYWQLRVMTSTT